jgi:peptide/nickel transport system permease protein
MDKPNPNLLIRWGGTILLILYIAVIFADVIAPFSAYSSSPGTSLLPPTPIHWRDRQGNWTSPHTYPITAGPIDVNNGNRTLNIDWSQPSPIGLGVKGDPYKILGIPLDRHLFGTIGPGQLHPLGTDDKGRDQFSRLLHGGRVSLFIGLVGIAIAFPLGMVIGGIAGYFGGWTDAILMRLCEVLLTLPTLYLFVALAAILPLDLSSIQRFLLITAITSSVSWAGLARVIRGQVLSLRQRDYVQASIAMGAKPLRIILTHILPQTLTYAVISATLTIPGFIVGESILSLLGLGIRDPDPSWGNMLALATNPSILVLQPWLIWPPALAIIVTVIAYNLLGDGLRDALDPRGESD